MNEAMALGFICGIVAVVVLFRLLARKLQNDGSPKTAYDERQLIERGKGYRCAFFAYVIYNCVFLIADLIFDIRVLSIAIILICGILVASAVHVIYCIIHEAYWGLNNNVKSYLIILIVAGGLNLVIGIMNGVQGNCFTDGVLALSSINLIVAVFIFVILAAMLVKWIGDKREVE